MKRLLIILAMAMPLFAQSDKRPAPPQPEWVPDPSAGHYDCPDGWIAYESVEPKVYRSPAGGLGSSFTQEYFPNYSIPHVDKKGHVLSERPKPPICIQEKNPLGGNR
jgi:hypothetical protein